MSFIKFILKITFILIVILFTINFSEAEVIHDSDVHQKAFGSWAQGLMMVGGIYIIITKSKRYAKRKLRSDTSSTFTTKIMKLYIDLLLVLDHKKEEENKKSRREKRRQKKLNKLQIAHKLTMMIGFVFGSIHGISMLSEEYSVEQLTGIILVIPMLILILSGILLWVRRRIYWENRKVRRVIRSSHINNIVTLAFYIILLIHGGLFLL